MILFHGSNVEVLRPSLGHARRPLDFGKGFYLTSDFDQAARWAQLRAERTGAGSPVVTSYNVDASKYADLDVREFPAADVEWLRYVASNRRGASCDDWDVVSGPVANDRTIWVINGYMQGRFDEDIALRLLLPQNLTDQYAFKTKAAIGCLALKEVIGL